MATRFYVYVCVSVEGMYTYKTENFGKSLCVYVCVVVEGMYTCKTGNSDNELNLSSTITQT